MNLAENIEAIESIKKRLREFSLPFQLTPIRTMRKLNHMNPSRRIARDLKACIFAGPILLLMWVAKGCG